MVARDYKRSRARSDGLTGGAGFALGLGIGLVVAAGVWVFARTPAPDPDATAEESKPAPLSAQQGETAAAEQYDFYEMLPKFEVVIPEKDKEVSPPTRTEPVDAGGSYVLQVGSYKDFNEADRIRAQLALQGIESRVQKVSVDADTWHRVRVGPITNLKELNRIRSQLRDADMEALVIRVGD